MSVSGTISSRYTNLVDLAPALWDPRNIEQYRAMLPERTSLDIVDEAYSREVHIMLSFSFHNILLDHVRRLGGAKLTSFHGHDIVNTNGGTVLC